MQSSFIASSPISSPMISAAPELLSSPIHSSSSQFKPPFSEELECRKICLNRFKYILLASIVVQYILFLIFAIPLDLSYLHPFKWLSELLSILCSPLSLVSVIYGICSLNFLLKEKIFYPTRMSKFIKGFSQESLMLILNFFIGLFTARTFIRYLHEDYRRIASKNQDGIIFNDYHSFLLLNGVFSRIYFYLKQRKDEHEITLNFPLIHQSRISQIRREFVAVLKSSFTKSIIPTVHHLLFYIFFGSTFSFLLKKAFFTSINDSVSFWNILTTLFNPRLLIYSWILTSLILNNTVIVRKIINIFATEAMQFPIAGINELTITKALQINKFQITQHLAAQDLYILADCSNNLRRKEIYSLSIPGGHPHNWKHLVQQTTSMIEKFTSDLKINVEYVAKNRNNNNSPNYVNDAMTRFFDQKRIIRESNQIHGIRSFMTNPVEPPVETVEKRSKLLMSVKSKLLSNRIIAYLFGEEESGKLSFLLMQQAQIMIWIIEGISAIVARSLKEDNYGIVQHDVKFIIKTFVKLKQTLDKVSAINAIAKDKNFLALKSALRRSLYRIVNEFSKFFDDMLLDAEDVRALHGFVTFREL